MKRKSSFIVAIIMAILVVCSATSNITTIGLAVTAPASPTAVKATVQSSSGISISWTKVTGAIGYTVFRSTSSKGTYSYIGTTTTTSYRNIGLPESTTFYYKIKAYKLSGKTKIYSISSSIVFAKTLTLPPNYKGVVFYGSFNVMQLLTEGFSANQKTKEEFDINFGGASRQYAYCWSETMWLPKNATDAQIATAKEDQKLAPRYFRVNLTKAQKIGKNATANFLKAIQKEYQAPTINVSMTSNSKTNKITMPNSVVCLPRDTTKVLFDLFPEDLFFNKKVKTDTANWAAEYVAVVQNAINQVKIILPNVKVYVCTPYICNTSNSPRLDDEHPGNKYWDIIGIMMSGQIGRAHV